MTFTGYSGADPEWNTAADYSNGTVQGLDFAIPPQPRQFVFGINLIYNFKEKSCMKRKIYYASPIWGLLLIQTSCDSILNQTPANYVSNSEIYSTVNQANQVIDKVTLLNNVSNTQKMRIISEATLIRSLAFFDLARTWGNVSLIREATSSPTQFSGVKQTDAKEVYREVITDVTNIYGGLSAITDRAHVSKATADAFLARVYLYSEDWDSAEKYATRLIENTNYELVDYPTFMKQKQSSESIWELTYSSSFQNNHSYYWLSSNNGGRHEWGPSKELVKLLSDPLIGGTRKVLYSDLSTAQVPDYYVGNLYYRSTGDDPAYLFRISEQYLIRAEARIKKSTPDVVGALVDLNAVRKRSGVPDFKSQHVSEIIQAIEDENRVEFALEPHRWFDLVRTHRATFVLGIKEYQTIFPIPYNDILADPDLVQNENY